MKDNDLVTEKGTADVQVVSRTAKDHTAEHPKCFKVIFTDRKSKCHLAVRLRGVATAVVFWFHGSPQQKSLLKQPLMLTLFTKLTVAFRISRCSANTGVVMSYGPK